MRPSAIACAAAGVTLPVLVLMLTTSCAPRAGEPPPARTPATTTSAAALYREGIAWIRRGDPIRAERYLALAVRSGYPERRALPALIDVCIRASRLRAALDHLEPYLQRHPDAWRVRHLVASLHLALGNQTRALEELSRVAADPRADAAALYLHARLLQEAPGRELEARASFAAYLERAPRGPHAAEARLALAAPTEELAP